MQSPAAESRETCWRCRRPVVTCWCAELPALPETKTRVVIVQHPRERDVAIGTARMTWMALPGSRLVEGTAVARADGVDRQIPDLFEEGAGEVAVLFPGDDARPLSDWLAKPPRVLIVVDGTWSQARKILKLNPRLAALPRLSYDPPQPGNYRIRREPTDKHLSTIEATAAVLGALEGDPDRFSSMLQPFTVMVDRQLAAAAEHQDRRRHQKTKTTSPLLPELQRLDFERAVVVYAEANCHPRCDRAPGAPEVVHLIASRPFASPPASSSSSSLDRRFFEALVRPRRPLHETVPKRLALPTEALLQGEDVGVFLARFRAFAGDDPWVCWGPFARDLLAQEGEPKRGFVDVRALVARTLRRQGGGIEKACVALGVKSPWADDSDLGPSRTARMQAGIVGVLRVLRGLGEQRAGPAESVTDASTDVSTNATTDVRTDVSTDVSTDATTDASAPPA